MPCDTKLKNGQTLSQRADEVRQVVSNLDRALQARRVKITIGPQGAIAFSGLTDAERAGVTDACAYRRLMATGTALARAEIAKAEQLSGRTINRQVIGQGAHSHDGGKTWHGHKG
jgi:hypothetical protein